MTEIILVPTFTWWQACLQRLRPVVDATAMHGHGHAAVIGPALIAHAQ